MSEKEKACLEVLIEAGCSEEWARGFLSLWKEGKVCEAMRILTERRRELLEKLHTDQRQLDCLDYFIYQMKKKKLEICSEEGSPLPLRRRNSLHIHRGTAGQKVLLPRHMTDNVSYGSE